VSSCYHVVQNLLHSHLPSKNIKNKIHKTNLSVVLYGCADCRKVIITWFKKSKPTMTSHPVDILLGPLLSLSDMLELDAISAMIAA
jgi:hypothetical protein